MEAQEEIGWMNFVLGRWSTKWLLVQKKHYERIKSEKIPKRWVVAILHKLMMILWDMWDFRNDAVHAPSGPLTRQESQNLDIEIEEAYIVGGNELQRGDRYLFTNRTMAETIATLTPARKRQWLEDVFLARERRLYQYDTPIPTAQLRRTMENYVIHEE